MIFALIHFFCAALQFVCCIINTNEKNYGMAIFCAIAMVFGIVMGMIRLFALYGDD